MGRVQILIVVIGDRARWGPRRRTIGEDGDEWDRFDLGS